MKHFILGILLLILQIKPCQSTNPFESMPKDVFINLTWYLEPADIICLTGTCRKLRNFRPQIIKESLPHVYKKIDQDIATAFMQFDHPKWDLKEKIPFQVLFLAHMWYLHGTKLDDNYKKFCFLMAAGRAGHFHAAVEAGHMLLRLGSEEKPLDMARDEIGQAHIPCIVLLKDIETIVPQFADKAIQKWSIMKLDSAICDDQLAQDFQNQFQQKSADVFKRFNLINVSNLHEQYIIDFIQQVNSQHLQLIDETILSLSKIKIRSLEFDVLEKFLIYEKRNSLSHTSLHALNAIIEKTFFSRDFDFTSENISLIFNLTFKISKKLRKNELAELEFFIDENLDLQSNALFVLLISHYFNLYSEVSKQYCYNLKLRQIKLSGLIEFELAESLRRSNLITEDSDYNQVQETAIEYQYHCILGALLGNQLAVGKITEDLGFYRLLKENEPETLAQFSIFAPMQAFALQLNSLAQPINEQLISTMADFYYRSLRRDLQGHLVELNLDRHLSLSKLHIQLTAHDHEE